jgi:hypothetical protein
LAIAARRIANIIALTTPQRIPRVADALAEAQTTTKYHHTAVSDRKRIATNRQPIAPAAAIAPAILIDLGFLDIGLVGARTFLRGV